jgi:hypothetical protein
MYEKLTPGDLASGVMIPMLNMISKGGFFGTQISGTISYQQIPRFFHELSSCIFFPCQGSKSPFNQMSCLQLCM